PKQLGFGPGGPPTADLMMSLDARQTELSGLAFDIGRECERPVIEGTGHHGQAAVVQVVARKPD
ncbi:MAG: SAM-dependent methyltransferase, partial [Arenibacter algicola]|nr:SAM-dependent methyltransferase [Arenibacter algicola]